MKRLAILVSLLGGTMAVVAGLALAQSSPVTFTCIVGNSSGKCPDASTALSAYNVPPGPTYVAAAGYFQQSDGGGGEFYRLGSITGPKAVCANPAELPGATGTVGSSTIKSLSTTTGLVVGELVSGSGSDSTGTIQTQPGTEIASISGAQVTLTLPLTGTATDNDTPFTSVTFTGDNTGTLIVDAGGDCYQKTNYGGDPHEWGAYGDAALGDPALDGHAHDDTAALQNWLGAYGNVSSSFVPVTGPSTAPPNFGPHVATMPGAYLVSAPLSCPANTTIQGWSNLASGTSPRFQIVAASKFSGLLQNTDPMAPIVTQAVIGAHDFCRLSGVGITASQPIKEQGTVTNGSMTISGLNSVLGINIGNAVTDVNGYIPPNTTVTSTTGSPCCSVTVSQNAVCSTCGKETIIFSPPISLSGSVSHTSKTITFPVSVAISGLFVGNAVTGPDIPVNTTVAMPINTGCSPTPCVVISNFPNGDNSMEPLLFWPPDGIEVLGLKVTVDGFSYLSGGRYGIDCGDNGQLSGLRVEDVEVNKTISHGIYMPANCANVRLLGINVAYSGGKGIVFGDNDLTLANGIIQNSADVGLDIERMISTGSTSKVSVTGITFAQNGASTGGAAIQIVNADSVAICANHFDGSGTALSGSAHVRFVGSSSRISLCSNVYGDDMDSNGRLYPDYVYGAASGASLAGASFYESPLVQGLGAVAPSAAALMPQSQVMPATRNFLTGLELANSGTTAVNIAPGSATGSTGNSLIPLASACSVDLSGSNGLGHLDTGSLAANTTYFYFVVEDLAPVANLENTPSCMASKSLSPSFAATGYGYGVYRLVGALFTNSASAVIGFRQSGDLFYLLSPVNDIQSGMSSLCGSTLGTTASLCPLSVPCGRTAASCVLTAPQFGVEAFGRIVGGSSYVLLSSPNQADLLPTNFPAAPGYTTYSATATAAYPFHVRTDISGNVRIRASGLSPTVYEITDGWIWHRQQ